MFFFTANRGGASSVKQEEAEESDDGEEWNSVAIKMKEQRVMCSYVIVKRDSEKPMEPGKQLESFFQKVSDGESDSPWFQVSPEHQVRFSGLSINKVASPTDPQSRALDDVKATPGQAMQIDSSSVPTLPANSAHLAAVFANQQQNQQLNQQALRLFQAQAALGSRTNADGTVRPPSFPPEFISSLVQAAKNGQIDPSSVAMRTLKSIIMANRQAQQSAPAGSTGGQADVSIAGVDGGNAQGIVQDPGPSVLGQEENTIVQNAQAAQQVMSAMPQLISEEQQQRLQQMQQLQAQAQQRQIQQAQQAQQAQQSQINQGQLQPPLQPLQQQQQQQTTTQQQSNPQMGNQQQQQRQVSQPTPTQQQYQQQLLQQQQQQAQQMQRQAAQQQAQLAQQQLQLQQQQAAQKLQQQQQQAQGTPTGAAQALGHRRQPSGQQPQETVSLQQAQQMQAAAQAQQVVQVQQAQQVQQQQSQGQQPPPLAPLAPLAMTKPSVWKGNLLWLIPPSTNLEVFVEIAPFNNDSPADLQVAQWPQSELRVSSLRPCSLPEIQSFGRSNGTPFVSLYASIPEGTHEQASQMNMTKFNNMLQQLHQKSMVSCPWNIFQGISGADLRCITVRSRTHGSA